MGYFNLELHTAGLNEGEVIKALDYCRSSARNKDERKYNLKVLERVDGEDTLAEDMEFILDCLKRYRYDMFINSSLKLATEIAGSKPPEEWTVAEKEFVHAVDAVFRMPEKQITSERTKR